MRVQHAIAHGLTTAPPKLSIGSRTGAPLGVSNFAPEQARDSVSRTPDAEVVVKPKPKKSFAKKLFHLAGWTGMAFTTAAGALGGIGYLANRDAMQKPTVSVYLQPELFSESGQANHLGEDYVPQAGGWFRDTTGLTPSGISVELPKSTVKEFTKALRNSPQVDALIRDGIDYATKVAETELAHYTPPAVDILLDARTPLPTGENSFFRLGDLNLPSMGLKSLKLEEVPLALRAETDTIHTGLTFEILPLEPDDAVEGPGIQLGAVRARVGFKDTVKAQGTASLQLDLNGKLSKEKLANLDQDKHPELAAQLERRLESGRTIAGNPVASAVLQSALQDQTLSFEAEIKATEKPVAEATFRLWLVPDNTGDGRADIAITQESNLEELKNLDIQIKNFERQGEAPSSVLGGKLNEIVTSAFKDGLEQAVPGVVDHLRTLALDKITEQLARGNPFLNAQANKALETGYTIGREGIEIPTHSELLPSVQIGLGEVRLDKEGNLKVGLRTTGSDRMVGVTNLAQDIDTPDGQLSLTLQGELLNQQLKDKSAGGALDWGKFLEAAREKNGFQELQFGKDEQGQTIYPRLISDRGMPAVKLSLVIRPEGAKPIDGATGLVTGATGGLDSGAAWVQEGLSDNLGIFGDVLGGVLRAPTFLVDQVAGGAEAVVDNTVGLAVDGVTEPLTRATVHTGVVIPLDLSFKEGELHVNPSASEVRFTNPDSKLPFDPLDLVPTRWLSHAIVNTAAEIAGPSSVGSGVKDLDLGVDLTEFGGKIKSLSIHAAKGETPDFVFGLDDSAVTVDWVANQLSQRLSSEQSP